MKNLRIRQNIWKAPMQKNGQKIWTGNSLDNDIQMASKHAGHTKSMALMKDREEQVWWRSENIWIFMHCLWEYKIVHHDGKQFGSSFKR